MPREIRNEIQVRQPQRTSCNSQESVTSDSEQIDFNFALKEHEKAVSAFYRTNIYIDEEAYKTAEAEKNTKRIELVEQYKAEGMTVEDANKKAEEMLPINILRTDLKDVVNAASSDRSRDLPLKYKPDKELIEKLFPIPPFERFIRNVSFDKDDKNTFLRNIRAASMIHFDEANKSAVAKTVANTGTDESAKVDIDLNATKNEP